VILGTTGNQSGSSTPVVHEINMPTEEQINAVLGNKKAIQMELTNGQ
jgi:hypothetical protein